MCVRWASRRLELVRKFDMTSCLIIEELSFNSVHLRTGPAKSRRSATFKSSFWRGFEDLTAAWSKSEATSAFAPQDLLGIAYEPGVACYMQLQYYIVAFSRARDK